MTTKNPNCVPTPCGRRAPCFKNWPPDVLAAFIARLRWLKTARPAQLPPQTDWRIWMILAGRGFGKTRTGAEELADVALWNPGARLAVVAPTYAAARDVCVEGESGLLSVIPALCLRTWNRSLGELHLINGSRIKLFSADRPDRLRGPQHHAAWGDEAASWRAPEVLDHLLFGLRLGARPRLILTTTPRPLPWLRDLAARHGQDVQVTRGTSFDNAAHLPGEFLCYLRARYAGTRLGQQELYAEILEETPGALWPAEVMAALPRGAADDMQAVMIGVDPALSVQADGCETGIVAAARLGDGAFAVLADVSVRGTPEAWTQAVARLAHLYPQARVVVEVNAGGDLVAQWLRRAAPHLRLILRRAQHSKVLRAQPVAALYAQGRVRHVGVFAALEDQMQRFSDQGLMPGRAGSDAGLGGSVSPSPDRVDALVWALSELMLTPQSMPRLRRI